MLGVTWLMSLPILALGAPPAFGVKWDTDELGANIQGWKKVLLISAFHVGMKH